MVSASPDDPNRPPEALKTDLRFVRSRPERAFNIGVALGLLLATGTFIFLVQNRRATHFQWLWIHFTLPLWVALVGALVVGAALVVIALAVHALRRRRITRREQAAARLEDAIVPPEPPGRVEGPMQP